MKTKILLLLSVILVPITLGSALQASAPADLSTMVDQWREQRDRAMVELAGLWLREQEPERRARLLQRVVTLDLRLATQPGEVLATDIEGKPEGLADAERRIVLSWLERQGWNPDSRRFLRDRSFRVVQD